jgi:5-(carboxyamino)imidazole ribonucleotide synthase
LKKIGILGGGQLGRMFIQEAINFGLNIHILDPDENAPCRNITNNFTLGSFKDFDTVYNFGKDKDIISIEIEHVNIDALKKLVDLGVEVYPQPEVLEMIQDKGLQKQFYQKNNIPSAEFILLENKSELVENKKFLPAVQKLRKGGYDGKGVFVLKNESKIDSAFDAPSVLEKLVPIKKEIAVIVARNKSGEIKTFPTVELVFEPKANLVDFLFAPAEIEKQLDVKANKIAIDIIEKMNMIGILAVEMFVDENNDILVNEMAPRAHNSGHHTIEANITSQYEQMLRAIMNWPLGDTSSNVWGAMLNIVGEENYEGKAKYDGLEKVLEVAGAKVHIYGKEITKPFRKMGHVTLIGKTKEEVLSKVNYIKENFKVIS